MSAILNQTFVDARRRVKMKPSSKLVRASIVTLRMPGTRGASCYHCKSRGGMDGNQAVEHANRIGRSAFFKKNLPSHGTYDFMPDQLCAFDQFWLGAAPLAENHYCTSKKASGSTCGHGAKRGQAFQTASHNDMFGGFDSPITSLSVRACVAQWRLD